MSRRTISSGRPVPPPNRRSALRAALAGIGAATLAGCDRLSNNPAVVDALKSAQHLSHGAQRLVAGERKVKRFIRCPYHSWAYDLNGRCIGTPRFTGLPLRRRSRAASAALAVAATSPQGIESTTAESRCWWGRSRASAIGRPMPRAVTVRRPRSFEATGQR